MRKSATDGLPIIRRIYFIKSAFDIHAYVIITFGKGKSYSLLHVFNDNLRILSAGHSLYSCECRFHKETDIQFHSATQYEFDNQMLSSKVLYALAKDNPSFKKTLSFVEKGILKAIEDKEIIHSKYLSSTEVHSYKVLYEIGANGLAHHNHNFIVATWSSDYNAFITMFLFRKTVAKESQNGPVESIPLPIHLGRPKFYHVVSTTPDKNGGPIPIDNLKDIQSELMVNLVGSGNYEIEMERKIYSEVSCADIAADIAAIMGNSSNYDNRTCEDSFENFIPGLTYRSFPFHEIKTAGDKRQTSYSVVMFDDNSAASICPIEQFSRTDF